MNSPEILFLDDDPEKAAAALCDQDLKFAVISAAAIASTVNGGPNRANWPGHPIAVWAAEGISNYNWLIAYGKQAAYEYSVRFDQEVRQLSTLFLLEVPAVQLPEGGSPFPRSTPPVFGIDNVHASRYYYQTRLLKATWTNTEPPEWWAK